MTTMFKSKSKSIFIILSSVFFILVLLAGGAVIYVSDYYRATDEAEISFAPEENIQSYTTDDGHIVFEPESYEIGFIFYPGGKVEHRAYQPLMAELAREGVLCILIKMPFNLAVLNMDAADGIKENFSEVERWYIGGHSLGGSMAASHLVKNATDYSGLVLLGAYSTQDLSGKDLDVISIYGSEDKIMNREKYEECLANLPEDYLEVVIIGGCHAFFGSYGTQDGDGTPTISVDEQIELTVIRIMEMINKE